MQKEKRKIPSYCKVTFKVWVVFFLLTNESFITSAQPQRNEWLKTITENAIGEGSAAGKYQQPRSGFALYFSKAGYINVPYIVYVPKGYRPDRPHPLVVFLHGAILARDSFQYKDPAIAHEPIFSIADTLNIIVAFPFARSDFVWGRQTEANENIITIINQAAQTYNVDKKRIYIGGISMGGNATYWFVNNKPGVFAGFYAFSSMPAGEDIRFHNITKQRPLYTMNAKDDPAFSYQEVAAFYDARKKEAPFWHFYSVETGGHRFIYSAGGSRYVKQLLGELLGR